MTHPTGLVAALVIILATLLPAQQSQTLPAGYLNIDGNSAAFDPFNSPGDGKWQFHYDSAQFAAVGPIEINQVYVRAEDSTQTVNAFNFPGLEVRIIEASTDYVVGAHDPVFVNNIARSKIVRSGSWVGGPVPPTSSAAATWISFGLSDSFLYDPSAGADLIIEIVVCGAGTNWGTAIDMVSGASVGGNRYGHTTSCTASTQNFNSNETVPVVKIDYCPFMTPTIPGHTVTEYASLPGPSDLVFDAGGALYTGRDGVATGVKLRRIPPGGGSVFEVGGPMSDPDGLAFDADGIYSQAGSILIANGGPSGGIIYAYHPNGTFVTVVAYPWMVDPNDIALDRFGGMYIADDQGIGSTIHMLGGAGGTPNGVASFAAGSGQIVVNSCRRFFVSDDTGTVSLHYLGTSAPTVSGALVSGLGARTALVLGDGSSNWGTDLYAADQLTGDILRIDGAGNRQVFASAFAPDISGIAFGPDDAMYVASRAVGKIYRIEPPAQAPVGQDVEFNLATNRFYRLTSPLASWDDARRQAEAWGGHLVTINDAAEQSWLEATFGRPGSTYWIGLTDEAQEGVWVWESGEPVSYTNWCPGEPDSNGGYENYATLRSGCWHDWPDRPTTPIAGIVEMQQWTTHLIDEDFQEVDCSTCDPLGWSRVVSSSNGPGARVEYLAFPPCQGSPGGALVRPHVFLRSGNSLGSYDVRLTSPTVDATALTTLICSFTSAVSWGSFQPLPNTSVELFNGSFWLPIADQSSISLTGGLNSIDVTAIAAGLPSVTLRFRFSGTLAVNHSPTSWLIDNVRLHGLEQPPYPGSGDDFVLETLINGGGFPAQPLKSAIAGDSLEIFIRSPGGNFIGFPAYIAAQPFTPGSPPIGPSPFASQLHVNLIGNPPAALLYGQSSVFGPPTVTPSGTQLGFQVPNGLTGMSVMIQSLAVSGGPPASNGVMAISDGHEITFF